MKRIQTLLVMALSLMLFSSCLEHNLVDLDTYDECYITGVYGVYHRYYLDTVIPGSGEKQVTQASLTVADKIQDTDAGTYSFSISLPSNFPEGQKSSVSASNLVVILNISTAAVIEPMDGAPILGAPGDWSKPNKYKVTGGGGSSKIWTVALKYN